MKHAVLVRRALAVPLFALFVLGMLASSAGAQDTSQVEQDQDDQIQQDDGSSSTASDEVTDDVSATDDDSSAAQDQYAGDGCTLVERFEDDRNQTTDPFPIGTDSFRIVFRTEPTNNRFGSTTDISVVDADTETQIDSVTANRGRDGELVVQARPGRYYLDIFTFEQAYDIVVEVEGGSGECTEVAGQGDDRGDVVDDTIPDKKTLAKTGGMPLLGVALLAMALVGSGLSVLRYAVRRDNF